MRQPAAGEHEELEMAKEPAKGDAKKSSDTSKSGASGSKAGSDKKPAKK
jgi:hypothetical protein